MNSHAKKILILITILFFATLPNYVHALSASKKQIYAQGNIIFYKPCDEENRCGDDTNTSIGTNSSTNSVGTSGGNNSGSVTSSEPIIGSDNDFTQKYPNLDSLFTQSGNATVWKCGEAKNARISQSGCPLVAAANALYVLGKTNINPNKLASDSISHLSSFTNNCDSKLFTCNSECSNSGIANTKWFVEQNGGSLVAINKNKIDDYMENGYVIIVNGHRNKTYDKNYCSNNRRSSNCVFGTGGHFITLVGKDGEKYQVANPANGGNRALSLEEIESGTAGSDSGVYYYAVRLNQQ